MARLTRPLFKKAFLLQFLRHMPPGGVFGDLRLQKLIYHFEKGSPWKPFKFIHYHYGPYSQELATVRDDLLQSNWIVSDQGGRARAYRAMIPDAAERSVEAIIRAVPGLDEAMGGFCARNRYRTTYDLRQTAYESREFKSSSFGAVLVRERVPAALSVPELSEDDVEDLSLAMSTAFVKTLGDRLAATRTNPGKEWREVVANA